MKKVIAKDRSHLRQLIDEEIEKQGLNANLNHIDVSNVESMDFMFYDSAFNGNISKWDVSNVESMEYMFMESKFNKAISKWDVSNVKNMSGMFAYSKFNKDISKWDVSNVKNMSYMFEGAKFNKDISKWDVSNVKNMSYMFEGAKDLVVVERCGENKRTIYLNKIDNTIVHVGCFYGTKDEAIEAISKKYSGKDKEEYINKIEELFMKRKNL